MTVCEKNNCSQMVKMNEYPFLRSQFNFSAETITQIAVNVCPCVMIF